MTIGNALFARMTVQNMGKVGAEIATLQERVSSGVNDPRPSADPGRASQLSALRDVRARLDLYDTVGRNAADRLSLTDQTLASVSDSLRRVKEITLRAANDALTPDSIAALRAEALMLRETLQTAANATDPTGRALFAGTGAGPAFAQSGGRLMYQGNDASNTAQLGERHHIATGLPGSKVFQPAGQDVFALLDDVVTALGEPILSTRTSVSAQSPASLQLARSRSGPPVDVTLMGPLGTARVSLDMRLDAPDAAVDTINATSGATGITALLEADGKTLRLFAAGEISISDQQGGSRNAPSVLLGRISDDGQPTGPVQGLRPSDLGINALVEKAGKAVDHMAVMRAEAGSLGAAVDQRRDGLAAQRLNIETAISQIQDLDVAAALTRLQTLLMTQQAAQMSFVKIVGQSLFNYLR